MTVTTATSERRGFLSTLRDIYHERTNFDFVGRSRWWALLSGTMLVISVVALLVSGLNLGIDFEGGSQWDVQVQGKAADIDDKMIGARLDTADTPDPDLMIRTSGEMRISNFMLWQLAYTELFITDVPWPAFTRAHLDAAFTAYQKRQRRFGLTGAQIEKKKAAQ